jgi:hypothetical protein
MSDTLLTVAEVASVLKCSEDAVTKKFSKLPGVIDLGRAETRSKRQYRVLRIPKVVVEKYLTTKSCHPVRIAVPPRPEHGAGQPIGKTELFSISRKPRFKTTAVDSRTEKSSSASRTVHAC